MMVSWGLTRRNASAIASLYAIIGNSLFFIGLMLIVLGTGMFKPYIAVMVGPRYTEKRYAT
jgi:dipeptide/tripeptide permease